jgi:hypothetical protein
MNDTANLTTLFTLGGAAIFGLTALGGSIVGIRKSITFRRKWYWRLLALAFASCLLAPFVYRSVALYNVSLADAFLLRSIHAGAWRVAEAYGAFLGLALGGLVELCRTRLSRSSRTVDRPSQ